MGKPTIHAQSPKHRPAIAKILLPYSLLVLEAILLYKYVLPTMPDQQVQQLLDTPTIEQLFKQGIQAPDNPPDNNLSLVQEAQRFQTLMDPPIPPKPIPPPIALGTRQPSNPANRPADKPLRLLGIVYYPARPQDSMALLAQIGQEAMWLKPGSTIATFKVEQITSTTVLVNDGIRTFKLALDPQGNNTSPNLVFDLVRPQGDPNAK